MPPDEFKNLIVECAWLFPGHGVANIMHDDPLMPLQVSGPTGIRAGGARRSASAAITSVGVEMVAIFASALGVGGRELTVDDRSITNDTGRLLVDHV